MEKGQIAYLTKYALSSNGLISKYKVLEIEGNDGVIRRPSMPYNEFFRIDAALYATEAEAVAACEKARVKRIASLEKQIEQLKKIEWRVAEGAE